MLKKLWSEFKKEELKILWAEQIKDEKCEDVFKDINYEIETAFLQLVPIIHPTLFRMP